MNERAVEIITKQQVTFQEAYELVAEYIYEKKGVKLEHTVNFNPNNPIDVQLLNRMFEVSREHFKKEYKIEDPTVLSVISKERQVLMQIIVKEKVKNEKK